MSFPTSTRLAALRGPSRANGRISDARSRLAAQHRRNGLEAFAKWNELAAWRAGMAEQISERAA